MTALENSCFIRTISFKGMVNLSEIFRSIFGPPKERLSPNDLPRNIHEDFEKLYGERPDLPWQQQPPTDLEEWTVVFEHPEHGEHNEEFHFSDGEFLQKFEFMFQNVFRGFPFDFDFSIQGGILTTDLPPDLPSEMPQESLKPNHSASLRDRMLKEPEIDNFENQHEGSQSEELSLFPSFSMFGDLWRVPFGELSCLDEQVDRDLDSEVEMGTQSLDDILQKDEVQMPQLVPHSSSSFSSLTFVDSNGVTEQRTTKRDSSGKEEVTITRKIDDQTHTVTQRKDGSGNQETQEDLVNIDHDELEEFNEKWHHSKNRGKSTLLSSIYDSVLEHFFPK